MQRNAHALFMFVSENISVFSGGSEKFQDKQTFFYNELKKHHSKHCRNDLRVVVSRYNVLESVSVYNIVHVMHVIFCT